MPFFQEPPRLANTYDGDPILSSYLARVFGDELAAIEPELRELGALAAGPFHALQRADRKNEPVHTMWDPWGNRVDHIEVTQVWKRAQPLSATHGLVAAGYEERFGARARLHQFAMNLVMDASMDGYSCPLAMTDGAARTLLDSGNQALIDRVVPRLTSRDPDRMWTSGQWMTERTGGSDVGLSETVARKDAGGWRLYGTKWFTSATTADVALTLGRPEGNPDGSRGLAMFFVQVRGDDGKLMPGIAVNRLKEKFGTKKIPTAELTLDGVRAELVTGETDGVRAITPMLSVTRTWNAIGSLAAMRRGLDLARDYAGKRRAFGALLADKPLHVDTLAGLEAEYAAAFVLVFRMITALGRVERKAGGDHDERLLRALTPITKLTTAKQAVGAASEIVESFGGAGYVEDTGLPRILADAQVLSIWEGTTNVLSLDTLRALGKGGAVEAVVADAREALGRVRDDGLTAAATTARASLERALGWIQGAMSDPTRLEAGARRVALTLGRSLELAYLCDHAQWCIDHGRGAYAAAAARRFARSPIDLVVDDIAAADSHALFH